MKVQFTGTENYYRYHNLLLTDGTCKNRCKNRLIFYTFLAILQAMQVANIKIPSKEIRELKKITGEKTGQKAVQKAMVYFMREARQRRIVQVLDFISFKKGFDPLKLRSHER
jgi:hypothetical protein